MPRTAAAAAPTTPTKGADSTKWAPSSVLDSSPLNWVLLHILVLTGAVLMAVYADSTFGFVICAVICGSLLISTFGQLRYNASFNGFWMQILAASTMIFSTIWQCNFAKPLPPQTSFSLGPFGNALLIGFSNLGLHLYEFHWATMTIFASGKMISSVVAPVWGIGKRNEVVLMGTCTLIGHACGYAIAINKRRLREEQASVVEMAAANRRADSRLNHVIKGLCGGANGLLDGLWLMAQQEGLTPSGHSQELFKQVRSMLDDAVEWCHRREVFVQIECGRYQPKAHDVALRAELEAHVGTDGTVDSSTAVRVDTNVLDLVVQEALSNARKHRKPRTPIHVTAEIVPETLFGTCGDQLYLRIQNENVPGAGHLSPEECARVFELSRTVSSSSRSRRSDGLGLDSVAAAMNAIGGCAWLTANMEHTTFHVRLPAQPCVSAPTARALLLRLDTTPGMQAKPHPDPLADAATRLVAQPAGQAAAIPDSPVGTNGLSTGADPAVERQVVDAASPPRALVCIGIDDSRMLRTMQVMLFKMYVRADMSRSGSLGETAAEVGAFVDVVMGRLDLSLRPASLPPADVVVVDENVDIELDSGEELNVQGSELIAQLRAAGYTGVACILTGATRDKVHALSQLEGVDIAFEKHVDLTVIASEILRVCACGQDAL